MVRTTGSSRRPAHRVAANGDTLALRQIRTGRSSDGMVEVLAGVSAGEKIVTSGTVFIDRAARAD